MNKKFYFILPLVLIIIVFGTAAICNMCTPIKFTDVLSGKDSASSTEETIVESIAETSESTQLSDETTFVDESSTTEESATNDESTDEESASTSTTEESATNDESSSENNEAPTIKLEIYEGPAYSAADDVCYYRVKAIVTGKPSPNVIFSKDDSNGAWGPMKVQINISRGNPYTLTAKAKNAAGEATDSIYLEWGCDSQNRDPVIDNIILSSGTLETGQQYDINAIASDPDGDILGYQWSVSGGTLNNNSSNPVKWTAPQNEGSYSINLVVSDLNGGQCNYSATVNVQSSISDIDITLPSLQKILSMDVPEWPLRGGSIDGNGFVTFGSFIYAGDSGGNGRFAGGEAEERGYICYDISGLSGRTITSVSLTFNLKKGWGLPWYDSLWVANVDWGPDAIVASDFNLDGWAIQKFGMETGGNFTCNSNNLLAQLQNYIDSGKQYFQLRIHWSDFDTDNDYEYDGWEYDLSKINLRVTYY